MGLLSGIALVWGGVQFAIGTYLRFGLSISKFDYDLSPSLKFFSTFWLGMGPFSHWSHCFLDDNGKKFHLISVCFLPPFCVDMFLALSFYYLIDFYFIKMIDNRWLIYIAAVIF